MKPLPADIGLNLYNKSYTMKKKIFTLLIMAAMISISASSQTIKDNIDKLAKDKSTTDKAAKADVLIQQKNIFDSAQIKTTSAKKVSNVNSFVKTKCTAHKHKKKRKVSSK